MPRQFPPEFRQRALRMIEESMGGMLRRLVFTRSKLTER